MSAEPQMSQDALGSTSRSTGALSTTACTAVKINEEDIDPFTYRPPLWCVHVAIRGTIATRVKDYLACTHHHRDRVGSLFLTLCQLHNSLEVEVNWPAAAMGSYKFITDTMTHNDV